LQLKQSSELSVCDSSNPVVRGILEAATTEFAQHGLGGARLERIIANTHTSKRMVYYHFGNKVGLYKAVLEHVFNTVQQSEQALKPLEGKPDRALQRFVEQAFSTFSGNPAFVRLLTLENLSGATFYKDLPSIKAINEARMNALALVVERGQNAGEFRKEVKPVDVYMNIVGLCYYHVANRAAYQQGFSRQLDQSLKQGTFDAERLQSIVQSVLRYVAA
jgi:Tetracyclin repressor-like, C-terminal domain/Bacterial regulatory proteins, tetR family